MISNISCTKLIKENIRHRNWLAALVSTAFFLMLPVYSLLYISSYNGSNMDAEWITTVFNTFPYFFNCSRLSLFAVILAFLPILCALSGFSYIHSKEKTDFYHSLPVKRNKLYASSYLSGLIILFVPYFVCTLLTAAVCFLTGAVLPTTELVKNCTISFLSGILAVFVIYNACVFSVMLTGKTVTGLLVSLTVLVYPLIIFTGTVLLQTSYFHSFCPGRTSVAEQLATLFSPSGLFFRLITSGGAGMLNMSTVFASFLVSAVCFTAALLLYQIYPSEAAGSALAFPVSAPILKVLICIPCPVFLAIVIQQTMYISEYPLTPVLSILAAVLLCCVIDFIIFTDFKMLLKTWKSSLLSVAGVLAVICFFQFDLPGYDSYIPAPEKIQSIGLYPDTFSNYFSYNDYEKQTASVLEYDVPDKETDLIYALAQSGISNLENGILPDSINNGISVSEEDYILSTFRYRLNSGRTVFRNYAVQKKDMEKALKHLLDDTDYRRQIFPVTQIDKRHISDISLMDAYRTQKTLELNSQQREALMTAYESDLMTVSSETLVNGSALAELSIRISNPYERATADTSASLKDITDYSMDRLYIYPEFTATLELLESLGFSCQRNINPKDVEALTLTVYCDSSNTEKYNNITDHLSGNAQIEAYDDQITVNTRSLNDITLILNAAEPCYTTMLDTSDPYNAYLDITYKNGDYGSTVLK